MTIENWIQLLVPVISIFLAIISAAVSYFLTKKNQLNADERRLKEQYYLAYIKAVSNSVISNHTENSRDQLANAQNELLLIGSSEVVKSLMDFHDYCKPSSGQDFKVEKHDELLTKLIMDMRIDLYKDKKINSSYPTIHLTGKAPKELNNLISKSNK